MTLNSRQKQIIALLLQAVDPITLKGLADELGLSTRTVQRELEGISELLIPFQLSLYRKSGVGIGIDGDSDAKRQLQQLMSVSKSAKIYSQEERRYLLIQQLLTKREWTKLYYFSSKLEVTEATISNDLDKLDPWFGKHKIHLLRKPGLGVMIEAEEKSIRAAIIDHLHLHFSQEQLMDILSSYSYSFTDQRKLELSIRNHLLHFIDPAIIGQIEEAVRRNETERGYEMADSAYVGFVVHIALAVQRLKSGEQITIDENSLLKLKSSTEFAWARLMAEQLSTVLDIDIPESEIGYITMHLLGAKGKRILLPQAHPSKETNTQEYAGRMIRIVENELKVTLEHDTSLYDALLVHLEAAVNRISLHMEIRNPLLGHIRQTYPDIYRAAEKASQYLQAQLEAEVPEEETGYLAMHFGAALVRSTTKTPQRFRVLLACSSGMGTSRLLAAQIEKNFPHIHIVDTVSLLQLDSALRNRAPIDLILSTVPFEHEKHRVVVVNSFLEQEDIELIETHLYGLSLIGGTPQEEHHIEIEDTVMTVNRYGEGVVQLNEHMYFHELAAAASKTDVIAKAAAIARSSVADIECSQLERDLLQREELGGLVLEDRMLAMLHCRSDAVRVLMVMLIRFLQPIPWGASVQQTQVQTVLLLLAPRSAPKEHIEIISEISANLIEDDFVDCLVSKPFDLVRMELKSIIGRAYTNKTGSFLWGKR